jgi:choline dehydrogenase-like flavoprotein
MGRMSDRETVDVLIVGSGPSGSLAAHELASKGFSVLCLEQGEWFDSSDFPGGKPEYELLTRQLWDTDPHLQDRLRDYPMNLDECEIPPVMFSAVGGSSVLFGAQWMRLRPTDFRIRTVDGISDDWPISYDDLAPFYDEVGAQIGLSGLGGDPAYPDHDFPLPPHPMGPAGVRMGEAMNRLGWHWWPGSNAIPTWQFKHMAQCVRWGVCERGCPAGAKASFDIAVWPHATRSGAQLRTGARVARITTDAKGRANGAIWVDREGSEHFAGANAVILAANGIGSPRLLLMSDDQHPDGLANSSGLVGKNLMMHPNPSAIGIYDDELESWNGPAGQLMYSLQFYETDLDRGFHRGAKWNLMPFPGVLNILNLFDNLPFEQRWGAGLHRLSQYAGKASIWFAGVDDLPEESNRVTLDPTLTDSSGLPAPRVHFRYSDNTRRSIEWNTQRMMETHREAGAAHVMRGPTWPSGHLLGTARMGDDPGASVVNGYGRCHDVSNLFIIDGSVMVTGGAVNPTGTIAAFALRAARHLARTASQLPAVAA